MRAIPKHYWIKVSLGMLKRVFRSTTLVFPFLLLYFAASPSRHHKQKQSSGHSGVCCTSETTNSQLRRGHSTFPLASTCSIHQHGNSCPSEAEQLQSIWVGDSAAGCILDLSNISAVDISIMYESFWISYALLGSEAVNWVLVSFIWLFKIHICKE